MFKDNKRYVCAGKQGQFYMVDVSNNQVMEQWEGVRVYGLHCLQDSKVLAADSRNRIRWYLLTFQIFKISGPNLNGTYKDKK